MPNKWSLLWDGVTLLEHCITQVRQCPQVDRIIVSSDSADVRELAASCGAEVIVEAPIPDARPDGRSTIMNTISAVRAATHLSASLLMLVQCTSPFVNSADLQRLVYQAQEDKLRLYEVLHLSHNTATDQSHLPDEFFMSGLNRADRSTIRFGCAYAPSGMGYVFGPLATWPTAQRYAVLQKAPDCDINTMEDYQKALKLRADWGIYGMERHNAS